MADTSVVRPPKRHRFLRAIAWIVLILILLVVAVYFIGTSSAFLKSAILPRVSKSIHADVTVSDATISPFKQVILRDLKVQVPGQQPLVTAPEVKLTYSLMDIIGGHINVDEVTLTSPTVTVVENPDGTRNFDAIVKGQQENPSGKKQAQKEQNEKASKPAQIDLKKFALTDGTLKYIKNYNDKNHDTSEIDHFNVSLDNLKNGGTAKLTIGGDATMEQNPPKGTNGMIQAKVSGDFSLALSQDLKPNSIQGGTRMDIGKAEGNFAELATAGANVTFDVTPTEIKQVALKFAKGSIPLGQVLVSGPFDMNKMEGKVAVEVLSIDKQVMNLAGAASGIDFGPTVLNSTNTIQLSNGGKVIAASGGVDLGKLQLTQAGKTTPTLDIITRYDVTVDSGSSNAVLRQLSITGDENGKNFLKTELSSPMSFNWGNAQNGMGDSTLNVTVNNFNLADWKAFLNGSASSGIVNAQVKLVSQQGGKMLNFNADTRVTDLTVAAGSNQIAGAGVTLQANGTAADMKKFNLSSYTLQLARQNDQLIQASGSGSYDKEANSADVQANVQASVPALLALAPQTNMTFSSGKVAMQLHIVQTSAPGAGTNLAVNQTITGNLDVSELSGSVGKSSLKNFATSMALDVAKNEQATKINKMNGTFTEDGQPGGSFDVNGTYATNQNSQITAKLSDINQNLLRPFLEPALGDKKLNSVLINGSIALQADAQGNSAIKGTVTVTNLLVTDPENKIPATPLQVQLAMDVAMQKQVTDIHQLQVTLTPTERAKNELNISGHLDMSQTNATQGNVKIASDALDLTGYYDLFAGKKQAAGGTSATANPQDDTAGNQAQSSALANPQPEKEPDATTLPLKNFSAAISMGHVYLHEVDISNFQATASVDGGHVVLKPCQLGLNGAPVNADADIDMSVPGYKYAVNFRMQSVPLTPLVNTFAPDRKGQIGGTASAQANVTGAGITGASLQKNLNGKFDVTTTNLNLNIANVKSRMMKALINVVGSVPEIIHNPTSGALSALEGATGLGHGGLTEDLKKAPIESVNVHATAGSGKVNLQQAIVMSSAFEAEAKGTVTLAAVLTNSAIQIPVTISLGRALAEKVNLVAANTPTNAAYSALPDFYTMKGTVGNPKNDISKTALAKLTMQALTGNLNLGGTGGSVLKGVNGLLGNKSTADTNTPASSKSGNALQSLGGLLGNSGSSTNPANTNQSKSATVNNLLNNFFKKK
jgi:uncharacterized protein involved in outer membrane biogenesis